MPSLSLLINLMFKIIKLSLASFFLIFIFSSSKVAAENESYDELIATLEVIQKDIKTLERAIYSEADNSSSENYIEN